MKLKIKCLIICFLFSATAVFAQTEYGAYLKIDYLNIDLAEHHEFLDDITGNLANLKERRIENGEIQAWYFYIVVYPGQQATPYNYVSVTVSDDLDAFDYHKKDRDDHLIEESIENKYGISRSEMWRVRNSVHSSNLESPSTYAMMDYMNVNLGREFEYQMLEDEIARPLHETRMENDIMDAWEMYELLFPGGLSYGYNFLTGNFFSELQHLEFGFNEELIISQHPETNVMEFFEMIWSTRDLVQSEIWRLKAYR